MGTDIHAFVEYADDRSRRAFTGRPEEPAWLFGKFSLFGEFYSNVSAERGAGWLGTVNTWVTYDVHKNLRLDTGVYIGVVGAADDFHPWVGMTWRF